MMRVGTSAFTAAGWEGVFYPEGVKSGEYLSYYSQQFGTVEVDSTFYRIPAFSTVRKWRDQTPEKFVFACKVPQVITHEKVLVDCDDEMRAFVEAMEGLGEKLGPMLLQFPYFNKKAFKSPDEFLKRLAPFLKKLPKAHRWALEIRNKTWVSEGFLELLRDHKVALALIDHPWMSVGRPSGPGFWEGKDCLTADFLYIRLLGDRYGIEERTKTWDKEIVDRRRELREWVDFCRKVQRGGDEYYVYINNHYAGHAPATARKFLELWGGKAAKTIG